MKREEIYSKVEKKIQETVEKLNNYFHFDMKIPPIFYDVTGTTGGLAKSKSLSVHFNHQLMLQNFEDFLETTVPHEVCHIAVFWLSLQEKKPIPKNPHGATWKFMMHLVGVPAKKYHTYDIDGIKKITAQYQYQCLCKEHIIVGKKIHEKIKKSKMICKKCKTILKNGTRIIQLGFSNPSPNRTTKVREEN
jgi:SprT protein